MPFPLPVRPSSSTRSAAPRGERVLVDALPGSGVRLLWQVLRAMQEASGGYRSFARAAGLASTAPHLVDEADLAFPGAVELDHVSRRDGRWLFALPDYGVEIDLALLFERSSLVWSSEFAVHVVRELPASHTRLYLMRDGRALIDALWRGARRRLPCGAPTIDLYRRLDVFETCVRAWTRHVESWLQHASAFRLVRYEDLRHDLPAEIERLGHDLDLPVDGLRVAARVVSTAQRLARPATDWRERFGPEHRGLFKAIAGETLIRVGYEQGYDW